MNEMKIHWNFMHSNGNEINDDMLFNILF